MGTVLRRLLVTFCMTSMVFSVFSVLISSPPAADASNFGSAPCESLIWDNRDTGWDACVSIADNYLHQWCEDGVFGNQVPGMWTAFNDAMTYLGSATLIVSQHVCPVTSSRDVVAKDADYGAIGYTSWVKCVVSDGVGGSHPNRRCNHQEIRFNGNSSVSQYFDTYSERRTLACHEIGHSVGLRHGSVNASCMDNSSTLTSVHDDAHVDAKYTSGS